MNLHILNEALTKYGFSKELQYNDEMGFHGHQKGVAICLRAYNFEESKLPTVIDNYLPEGHGDKDANLREILNDPNIVKLYQRVNHMEGDKIFVRELVYIPYYVVGHSCFYPTINFDNVDTHLDDEYAAFKADIELLFVCDGTNRYITFHTILKHVSIWDAVKSFFDHRVFVEAAGGRFDSKDTSELTLDFYSEAGERIPTHFPSLDDLRDRLISFRLIGLEDYAENQTV